MMQLAYHHPANHPNPRLPTLTGLELGGELSRGSLRILRREDVMKAYFTNLPTRTWLLLVVPAVVIAYPVIRIVVPAVVNAVVPEAVRAVLSVI
jgi:hypothetical protein